MKKSKTNSVNPIQEIGKRQSGTSVNGVGHGQPGDPMFTLQRTAIHGVAIAFDEAQITSKENRVRAEPGLPASTINKASRMSVAIGIEGGETGFALRAEPSHSGDKGDGGVNTTLVAVGTADSLIPEVGDQRSETRGRRPEAREIAGSVSSKWSKGSGGPAGDECQNLVLVTGGFFNDTRHGFHELTRTEPIAFSSKDHGADASNNLSPTLRASGHDESHANAGAPQAIAFPSRMSGTQCAKSENVSCAIAAENPTAVAFQSSQSGVREVQAHATLDSNNGSRRHNGVIQEMAVRRLTPRECERLQGFPDDYTLVKYHGKWACDGPRYKAIGNSMAVPNIEWIGRRMDLVDELVPWETVDSG